MKFASLIPGHAQPTALIPRATDGFEPIRRLNVATWVFDIDKACILYANASACVLWQAEDEAELVSRDMSKGMSSTVAKRLKQYQADFIERDATFTEMWTLYPHDKPTNVMVIFRGYRLPDGRMAMQCEVVNDALDEPENVRSAEALLHTDVMIMLIDNDGETLYSNPAARNALPKGVHRFTELFADPADQKRLVSLLRDHGDGKIVTEVRTGMGQRWFDVSAKSCLDAATGEPAILATAIDVTELKLARDTARYLADRDPLTGCFSRAYLQSHLAQLAQQQYTSECAIIFFDVDRFKSINDRFGHEVGDSVLREIAARARAAIRNEDLIARLGGDEFVILLENTAASGDITLRMEELREAVSKPIVHDVTRINATVSIGVAAFVPNEIDFSDVIRHADIALYASKQAGRNRVTFFNDEMGRAARARDMLEVELRQAIEDRDFTLHYQPRVDLTNGRVVSVEGLVRWQHSSGLRMPDTFIPICEETGLIEELGRLVLEMGCDQAISWHKEGLDIDVSLNVSPRQFNDARLLGTLREIARRPGFPTGRVELELTETVLSGDHAETAEKLQQITDMGYRIAIDDFGTGYSNLSYISRFPLKCLKIDRAFINQLPESGPIIGLILTLARQIGATAVAEGVETRSQMDWLARQHCEQAQGYYLSKPVPLRQFSATVKKINANAK